MPRWEMRRNTFWAENGVAWPRLMNVHDSSTSTGLTVM